MQTDNVGVSLASTEQINFLAAIDPARDDLDGVLFVRRFVSAAAANGEAAIAQHGLPQVHVVVGEEGRVLFSSANHSLSHFILFTSCMSSLIRHYLMSSLLFDYFHISTKHPRLHLLG